MNNTIETSTILACPECGGSSFSWIVEEVQFGIIHDHGDGKYSEEGRKRGEVVGSDVETEGVFCTECGERRDRDELVPVDDTTGTSQGAA